MPSLDDKFEIQKRIKTHVGLINVQLAFVANKIETTKKLTNHISRHTFGQIAGKRIPIPILQKLYRHSSITTTLAYQSHFTNDDTDEV